MGYACPVCETPQRDGEHLANHLAFTAMLGDEGHEEWLGEHAPGWEGASPGELADRVVEHATETEYEEVFEDTVDRSERARGHDHDHDHDHDHEGDRPANLGPGQPPVNPEAARRQSDGTMDAEAQRVLQEAQEMTRRLLEEADEGGRATDDDEEKDS